MVKTDNDDMIYVEGNGDDIFDFYICDHPVTQAEYYEIMGKSPSMCEGENNPVENVPVVEAIKYCNKRSMIEGLNPCYKGLDDKCNFEANGYRLPTEVEWEYAARGGKKSHGYKYSGNDDIDDVAWYTDNSNGKTHPVKQKKPNELGIYDMSGNVAELCWGDVFDKKEGWKSIVRGGELPTGTYNGFNISRESCEITSRKLYNALGGIESLSGEYGFGFRVVRSAELGENPENEIDDCEDSLQNDEEENEKAKAKAMIFVEGNDVISDLYASEHPVTQAEYQKIMGINPSICKGDDNPVENVSWYDAIEYCNKKSEEEYLTPCYTIDKSKQDPNNKNSEDNIKWTVTFKVTNGYRLPTDREWAYLAEGGRKTENKKYSGSDNLNDVAWYEDNSDEKTHPVKQKQPNELGLYDMTGNVWEWCWDWYAREMPTNPSKDHAGPACGEEHVCRGGSWDDDDFSCGLSSNRMGNNPISRDADCGFRIVRTANTVYDKELKKRTVMGTVYNTKEEADGVRARIFNGKLYNTKEEADDVRARTFNGKLYDTIQEVEDIKARTVNGVVYRTKKEAEKERKRLNKERTYKGTLYRTKAEADNARKELKDKKNGCCLGRTGCIIIIIIVSICLFLRIISALLE